MTLFSLCPVQCRSHLESPPTALAGVVLLWEGGNLALLWELGGLRAVETPLVCGGRGEAAELAGHWCSCSQVCDLSISLWSAGEIQILLGLF